MVVIGTKERLDDENIVSNVQIILYLSRFENERDGNNFYVLCIIIFMEMVLLIYVSALVTENAVS